MMVSGGNHSRPGSNKRSRLVGNLHLVSVPQPSALLFLSSVAGDPLASSTRGREPEEWEKMGGGGGRGENMWESAMINVLSEMD